MAALLMYAVCRKGMWWNFCAQGEEFGLEPGCLTPRKHEAERAHVRGAEVVIFEVTERERYPLDERRELPELTFQVG